MNHLRLATLDPVGLHSNSHTEETGKSYTHDHVFDHVFKQLLGMRRNGKRRAELIMLLSTHPRFLWNNGRLSIFREVPAPIMHDRAIIIRRPQRVRTIWLSEISFKTWNDTQKVRVMFLFLANFSGLIYLCPPLRLNQLYITSAINDNNRK